jgi:hypothetical protein
MLTWFNYGEYAIWHLWPAIQVSNDGRRETVYSERVRQAHAVIYADKPGAIDALERMHPDHVWLPVESPTIARLRKAGWSTVFRGPLSVVLTRSRVENATAARRLPIAFSAGVSRPLKAETGGRTWNHGKASPDRGFLYLAMMPFAAFWLSQRFSLAAPGNPARTAAAIAASEGLLRASIVSWLIAQTIFVFLVLSLYRLLRR